jgi:tripartite-type tricarboxylate transporter receptor subunit TctC
MVLVVNDQQPYKTLKELVDDAKKNPDKLIFSSSGLYGALHLPMALFLKSAGIKMKHLPTNGGGPALTAILGNNSQVLATSIAAASGQIKAGKLRALACFSDKRAASMPDVPTFKELGYDGFDDLFVANGLLAPTGTSPAIIAALNREMVRMNASGTIRERLLAASYEPGTLAPEQYGAMIDRELKLWGDVVQETGVRVKA